MFNKDIRGTMISKKALPCFWGGFGGSGSKSNTEIRKSAYPNRILFCRKARTEKCYGYGIKKSFDLRPDTSV